MATLINESILQDAEAVCVTFKPHPKLVLQPDHEPFLLTSFEQRLHVIEGVGVPIVCALPFTKELAAKTAQEFIDDVILIHPQIKTVIVGFNFHFGFKRQGTPHFLEEYLKDKGVKVIVVEPYAYQGQVVSSSVIREHIQNARFKRSRRASWTSC